MESEILLLIVTIVGNILITLIGILANIHITKISNADKLHEFKRHLTEYEVITKSPEWIVATVEDDDSFRRYDGKTRKYILKRYKSIKGKLDVAKQKALEQEAIYAMAMGPVLAKEELNKSDDNDGTNW